jgi:hypothetical protein
LPAFTITPGVIGYEADAHTRKLFEVVALQHIDARQHFYRRRGTFVARRELL